MGEWLTPPPSSPEGWGRPFKLVTSLGFGFALLPSGRCPILLFFVIFVFLGVSIWERRVEGLPLPPSFSPPPPPPLPNSAGHPFSSE